MPFAATQMDLEIITLNEVSQTEKDKYYMISMHVESKKQYKSTYLQKQKQTHRQKTNLWLSKGKWRRWDTLGVWD